jgi:hypothetical protein
VLSSESDGNEVWYCWFIRNGIYYRVEVGSNTSTEALPVVEGDEKGTRCSYGGYKYGDLALQVGGVSNRRQ